MLIIGALGFLPPYHHAVLSGGGNIRIAAGNILVLFSAGAFALGAATFSLSISRKEEAKLRMIFSGFKYYGKTLGLYLLMVLFILLWMLLLIVPGIIAAISYSLAFFIMSDDPNIRAIDAINKSKKMMYGYKWKYFCLGCRFIGWCILGILSLGIGFLWIAPYMSVSTAKFYEDVKAHYVERE
jgi:uncharacterized membrane protein